MNRHTGANQSTIIMKHEITVIRNNGDFENVATYVNDKPARESLIDYCIGYLFRMPGQILNPRYRKNATAYMFEGQRMWHLAWSDGTYSVRK
jgi:hypothetical protein